MAISTHQIRWAALTIVGLLAAHLRAEAQVQLFTFRDRGRLFYTSPSFFSTNGSANRQLVQSALEGSGKFYVPKAQFTGLNISGQYFYSGLFLGYQVGVGISPSATNNDPGGSFVYKSRDYTGDITANAGFVLMRVGGLRIIPSYGLGYGVWASHLVYQAQPEGPSHKILHDDKESAYYTAHTVSDYALQFVYTQPTLHAGHSRFSIGLKTGYKQYSSSSLAKTADAPIIGNYGSISMQGFYTQLNLGLGIFR